MLVTSASKANKAFGLAEFRCGQADVARKLNGWRKPELRFAVGMADMNMHPTFLLFSFITLAILRAAGRAGADGFGALLRAVAPAFVRV